LPSVEGRLPEYREPADIEKLLEASQTPTEVAIVTILFDSGMRIGELLKLEDTDVDWEHAFIFAHREKTNMEGWVPISRRSLNALKEYLTWRHTKDRRLFPFEYYDVWLWLKKLGKRAGIPNFHPHILRHSRAVQIRMAGGRLEDIKDLLGHRSLNTTMIYGGIKGRELKERIPSAFE